jgi:hypothetical protein
VTPPVNGAVLGYRTSSATLLLFVAAVSAVLSAQASRSATASPIDIEHSTVTVHVYRSGLFSFAGDNHEIQARTASGTVDEAAGTVEFAVDVRYMRGLDPFDFYLDHYKQQLVAGYTKETPSFGLRVFMHDFKIRVLA